MYEAPLYWRFDLEHCIISMLCILGGLRLIWRLGLDSCMTGIYAL